MTTTNLKVNVNDWNYIAVTYDGSNVVFYINGETESPSKSTGSYNYGSQGTLK